MRVSMDTKLFRLPLLLFLLLGAKTHAAEEYSLTVSVSGLIPGEGDVFVSVFASEDTFLRVPLQALNSSVGDSETIVVAFTALPPGVYAVGVVYDENSNGKLDTGFFHIPKEPVGTSNNPKPRWGPPRWKDAKFSLDSDLSIEVSVTKPG